MSPPHEQRRPAGDRTAQQVTGRGSDANVRHDFDVPGPRLRVLKRVVLHAEPDGGFDLYELHRATDHVRPGDDVVVLVRGRVGAEPAAAGLLGRALATARTVQVEGRGPWIRLFGEQVRDAAQLEAASWR